MHHLKIILFLGLIFSGALAFPLIKNAYANSEWELYVSESQLFSAIMPGNPDESVSEFRVSDSAVIQNAEALAFIDQRPYKNTVKNYIIKFDQTFGPAISTESRAEIIEREMALYENIYKDQNAKTIARDVENDPKKTTGLLTMVYDDIEQGLLAIKAKIVITETSKLHQIFTGPRKDLDAAQTGQYFKSLTIKEGALSSSGTMNEQWRRIESPSSLFAVKIPSVSAPYFAQEPTVTHDKNNDKIGMIFTDPIWAQNLYYNISGYRLDTEMSFDLAEKAILEKHIKRHGRSMVGIKLKKDFLGETPYIETEYLINPPKGYPYVNRVKLRAMFLGNYLIVQEVVGPRHLVNSNFTREFFDLIEFSPKKAFQKEIQKHLTLGTP